MSQEFSFSLPYDAFDLDLIGLAAADVGGLEFTQKVSAFFVNQFRQVGGRARVVCNDADRTIEVKWTKEQGFEEPMDRALQLLQAGKISEALPLLWTVQQERPQDPEVVYNLGVAYSELGQFAKSIAILEHLVDMQPHHVHGLTALGVAYIRTQRLFDGEATLRRALKYEPRNLWVLRNLGACLLKQGKSVEAVSLLELAVDVAPQDLQAIVGLGQALETVGRADDADQQYLRALEIGGPEPLLDFVKERRTAIAHQTMREHGSFRPDVLMYMSGALEKFERMSAKEIQGLGYEIAILGQNGLDINDPTKKYSLRTWPGQFSGLHLCSIMYAAFKQFAPDQDVGIDFAQEYHAAVALRPGSN